MREVANWFRGAGKIPTEVAALLGYGPGMSAGRIPALLTNVASTFADLQELRHRADYNRGYAPERRGAQAVVVRTRTAFAEWRTIAGTPMANLFLLLPLTGREPIQAR